MDKRTSQLLKALDPLAVDLLLVLLEEGLSEKDLVSKIGGHQPTVHKRLARLANIGAIEGSGDGKLRGSPWVVTAPHETVLLLDALFALSEQLEILDKDQRIRAKERLDRVLARERGMRLVKGGA